MLADLEDGVSQLFLYLGFLFMGAGRIWPSKKRGIIGKAEVETSTHILGFIQGVVIVVVKTIRIIRAVARAM